MSQILLLEGSRESALHLSRLIARNLDAELLLASSSSEALDLIQHRPVDLVIVDVQLPRIDGFDICNRLHEMESHQHIPVLLLTSLEGESYPEVKALSVGPGEIYTLPTPSSSLVVWIKILLKLTAEKTTRPETIEPGAPLRLDVYRLLLDAADDAILWADASSGRIRLANKGAEAITGYPRGLLEGKTLWDLAPLDHQERAKQIWAEACREGEEWVSDLLLVRRSGMHSTVALSLRAHKMADEDGVVVMMKDLTGQPSLGALDRPGSSTSELGEFFSALAHEVRNPLTGISTNVQYMQMTFAESETQREIYSDILEAVNRLDLMFREIVEYTRPMELRLEKADLNQLLSEALSQSEKVLGDRKRIKFASQLGSNLPRVDVDAARFQRALHILVEHCTYQVGEEGRITTASQATPQAITLTVSHDGQSLSAQRLKELFDPLVSLKSSESGLGLALAKRIFDEHNCRLEVASEPGGGAKFTVTFPLQVKSST